MTYDYDFFVIGGGSGGIRAARLAAQKAKLKTGLAEEYRMGGTCVIRGCVPKKLMRYACEYANLPNEAAGYGWDFKNNGFDWSFFQSQLHGEIARLEKIYHKILDDSHVDFFKSSAKLGGNNRVILENGREITARHILIATGGRARKLDIPGAEFAITSNEIFNLPTLPKSMLIIGGGYIACEFASILNAFNVKITMLYRGTNILRNFDHEISTLLTDSLKAHGIDVKTKQNATKICKAQKGLNVVLSDGKVENVESVLFATGRTPNSDTLNLEKAGILTGAQGEIIVDAYSKTAHPSIYAIGDVTNRLNLTPVAIREATALIDTVLLDKPRMFNHNLVPSAVFTFPEIGTIGLSEEVAHQKEPIEIYKTHFKPMHQTFTSSAEFVFMKLVVSKKTRKVLGCHIMGAHSAEMIQLAAIAITMGATKEQFDETCAVHPTTAEELVTLKNT